MTDESQQQNKVVDMFGSGHGDPVRTLLLVDDQPLFRNIARTVLSEDGHFNVVGEGIDGASAIELAGSLRPDVIIMDCQLPDMSGVEAARQILAEHPEIRLVLTSMGDDAEYGVLAREIGACGFATKRELDAQTLRVLIEQPTGVDDSGKMAA